MVVRHTATVVSCSHNNGSKLVARGHASRSYNSTATDISAAHVSSVHHCCWTTLVCVSCLSLAAEVDVKSVDCNTLQVEYTVNPLPGGGNEASLQSLVVKYRPILGAGSTGTRTVPLNGNPAEGVLCLSGLSSDTPYRVTYSVEVDTGASTGLPSDLSEPKELFTLRRCDQQNQCIETRTARKCNCIWNTACPQVYSGSTPCMCLDPHSLLANFTILYHAHSRYVCN